MLPLNDALNQPKHKLGIDWRVFLAIAAFAGVVIMLASLLAGIALFLVLPAAVRLLTRRDPQIFRLWGLSFLQSAHYDPGKVAR